MGFTALAGVLGAVVGSTVEAMSGPWLLLFAMAMMVAIFRYFFVWDVPKGNPLGLIFGASFLGLGAAIIVIWIGWKEANPPFLLTGSMGMLVGLVGCSVSAPGWLRTFYKRRIRPGANPAVLAEALGDPEFSVASQAVLALAQARMPEAQAAVPALLVTADGPRRGMGLSADGALLSLGVPTDQGLSRLKQALQESGERLDDEQYRAFGAALLPLIVDGLNNSDSAVRIRTARQVGKIGSAAESTVTRLTELLSDPDYAVRQEAASALGHIVRKHEQIPRALDNARHDENRKVAKAASQAMREIGHPPGSGRTIRRLATASVLLGMLSLVVWGCSHTPLGRANYLAMVRDLGGKNAGPVLAARLDDSDFEVRVCAEKGLEHLGPKAVPALLAALQSSNPKIQERAAELLGRIRGVSAKALADELKSPKPEIRRAAMSQLSQLKSEGADAVEALVAALKDEEAQFRNAAATALGNIASRPESAVPALAKSLEDRDVEVRKSAAITLKKFGKSAEPAVGPLVRYMESDPLNAAGAIEQIGPGAKDAVPALLKALSHEDAAVREQAAKALGAVEVRDQQVVVALLKSQDDANETVRAAAKDALARLSPEEVQLLKDLGSDGSVAGLKMKLKGGDEVLKIRLLRALKDGGATQRGRAAESLADCAATMPDVEKALIEALRDDEAAGVRISAANALASCGADRAAALTALKAAIHDPEESVRIAVCRSLAGYGVDAVPALQESFADASAKVIDAATISLARIGSDALPALRMALRGSDQKQKLGALLSLLRMKETARPALDDIRACLDDPAVTVQLIAARTLWTIDRDDSTVPRVAKLLQEKKLTSRRGAIRLLQDMGEAALPAVADLSEATMDSDDGVRLAAIRTVAAFGPGAAPAVDHLLKNVQEKTEDIRLAAIDALGRIGPRANGAVTALSTLLNEQDQKVVLAAIQALGRIGPDSKPAVATLLKILAQTRATDRELSSLRRFEFMSSRVNPFPSAIFEALGGIGPDATEAIPTLVQELSGGQVNRDSSAFVALERIDPAFEATVKIVSEQMASEGRRARGPLGMIAAIGPGAKSTVPAIVELLADPEFFDRGDAAVALAAIGPAAHEALPELRNQLGKEDVFEAEKFYTALAKIGADDAPTIGFLKKQAEDSKNSKRVQAAVALARMAPRDPQVFALVVRQLDEAKSEHRELVRALAAMDAAAGDSVAPLTRLLKHEDLSQTSIQALGAMGPRAKDATPVLEMLLQDKNVYRRVEAVIALWQIDGKVEGRLATVLQGDFGFVSDRDRWGSQLMKLGPTAIPELQKFLGDSDPKLNSGGRQVAAATLGAMGAAAKSAVPELIALLNDSDEFTARAAASALGQIGPDARPAIAALQQAAATWKSGGMGLIRWNPALIPVEALARIDPQSAAPFLDMLIGELSFTTYERPSSQAIEILGLMGPAARSALPALKAASNKADKQLSEIQFRNPGFGDPFSDAQQRIRGVMDELRRLVQSLNDTIRRIETGS